jgi:O-antigen biosynthesis alpha-1,2-mannosyltransferase
VVTTTSLAAGSVHLDARASQNPKEAERGIARFVTEHTRALVELAPEKIGSVLLDPKLPVPPSLEPLSGSGLLGWHSESGPPKAPTPSILHVMSPFELEVGLDRLLPAWARGAGVRTVVTLHDLIPLIFRDQYLVPDPFISALYMTRLEFVRAADQLVCNSECTARDAVDRLGIPDERVMAVGTGVPTELPALVASKEEAKRLLRDAIPDLVDGYLLYVGGGDPRKNLEGAVRAYGLLPEPLRRAHQLVIAGRLDPDRADQLARSARRLGIEPGRLLLTGLVSDRELAALYRCCELFVFPSLYEGGALPVLEAMASGAPVAASGTSAIPELLGDAEATFDPADVDQIAGCLRRVLEEPGRLEALRARSRERAGHFTWERVARRTLRGYERAFEVSRGAYTHLQSDMSRGGTEIEAAVGRRRS